FFKALLGEQPKEVTNPEQVRGHLGELGSRFGLQRSLVNTIAEEQNLSNYFIIGDMTIALQHSWDFQRKSFDRKGRDAFLGTQLVLLSRSLEVLAESAQEVEFALDSVFVGPAERQTTPLKDGTETEFEPILTVDELLSWIQSVATEESPRVINEAGKDGVISLAPTLRELDRQVEKALRIARTASSNPAPGFHTPRVQRSLENLDTNL